MKQIIKDYFNFTRQERIAVISLLILLLAIFSLPKLTERKNKVESMNADTAWLNTMRKLDKSNVDSLAELEPNPTFMADRAQNETIKGTNENPGRRLFNFNPNTISTEDWKHLGIKDKTIHTIQNYLSKGGSFKKPEDLQKIYGFSKIDYERLFPYIKIEIADKPELQQASISEEAQKVPKPYKKPGYNIIELNSADTTALIALPGIGSKLATRIITFRDKLGGFYSVEQVKETYGLQDSVFQKIKEYLKVNANSIKKININTVTIDDLKLHPYIKYNIATPIVAYRNEHGLFSKTEDVKKVIIVTDEIYRKIAPYIVTQ